MYVKHVKYVMMRLLCVPAMSAENKSFSEATAYVDTSKTMDNEHERSLAKKRKTEKSNIYTVANMLSTL